MAILNENVESTGETAVERDFTADIDALKTNFAQLRTDLNRLLNNALGIGKNSASEAVDGLKNRVSDLKDKGADYAQSLEEKVAEHPATSLLLAIGVGFILAKWMSRK